MYKCPVCQRDFESELGLKTHQTRMHKEEASSEPDELFGFGGQIREQAADLVRQELAKIMPDLQAGLSTELNKAVEATSSKLWEQVDARMSKIGDGIADKAQAELDKRMNGQGEKDPLSRIAMLAPLFKSSGTDLGGFQQLGNALGAVLQPVVSIWSSGVSQGLAAVGFAQRMSSGMVSPSEAAKELTESARQAATGLFQPPAAEKK